MRWVPSFGHGVLVLIMLRACQVEEVKVTTADDQVSPQSFVGKRYTE